jgi:hypothetical protein
MPNSQKPYPHHDRHKLQAPKVNLVCIQIAIQPLRRLRQPEAHPKIEQHHRHAKRKVEPLRHDLEHDLPCTRDEGREEKDEYEEGESLEGEAGEEDIVGRSRVSAVRLRDADESRANDLNDRGDDVAGDEDPEDGFGREGRVVAARGVDEEREDGVNCCGEEDGGYDDDWPFLLVGMRGCEGREDGQKYCTTKKATL